MYSIFLKVLCLSLQGHLGEFKLILVLLSSELGLLMSLLNFACLIVHPLPNQVWTHFGRSGQFFFVSHSANSTS